MVCKECKKAIAKNSNYCKYCGFKVEKEEKAEKKEKEEKKVSVIKTKKTATDDSALLFREVQVTEAEAEEGAERILDFDGAVEPLHIVFPKLFCTGQLFMVKKYKFLSEQGKKYKKNILIRVNIA